MYYFEGNYKTTPQQNLAGASRVEGKSELINRVQSERRKRQERRLKEDSAVVIQSLVRGFVVRQRLKKVFEREFDNLHERITRSKRPLIRDIVALSKMLPFLGTANSSRRRLRIIDDLVLRNVQGVLAQVSLNTENWRWRMKMLMKYNLAILEWTPVDQRALEYIETFTDYGVVSRSVKEDISREFIKSMFVYAVSKNYFKIGLLLLERSFENNADHAPSLNMIARPFIFMDMIGDTPFTVTILDRFCSTINDMDKEVKQVSLLELIIPKLKQKFPYVEFLKAISRFDSSDYNIMLLICALHFDTNQKMAEERDVTVYFKLMATLSKIMCSFGPTDNPSTSDDESEEGDEPQDEVKILKQCALLFDDAVKADLWILYLKDIIDNENYDSLVDFCSCLHNMLLSEYLPVYKNKIFLALTQQKYLLKGMWKCIVYLKRNGIFSEPVQLINLLARGIFLEKLEASQLVPVLTMFSYLMKFCYSLMTEEEFSSNSTVESNTTKPFSLTDLVGLSRTLKDITIGVILLAYPDTHGTGKDQFIQFHAPTANLSYNVKCWSTLLQEIVALVSLLHARDSRIHYTREGHWISNLIRIPDNVQVYDSAKSVVVHPFTFNRDHRPRKQNKDGKTILTTHESRNVFVLSSIPFTIPFLKRFSILQTHFEVDRFEYQNPHSHFMQTPHHFVRIRRDFMYEDAFDKLSEHNALDLKLTVKIQMVNRCGLDEAGVDGGGVFREFITDLLKTAFDPNRGFFIYNNDNELYPNPSVHVVCTNFEKHYSFIGRVLGKAIYEGIMAEIPFADFFLAKLTGDTTNLYLTNLASLDPELYKNIINLRHSSTNLSELGLDFTIYTNEFGRSVCRELKPNGSNIQVNSENVAEYIDLIAKYKMHKEIAVQTESFKDGLRSVFSLDWLKMFTSRELQVIISGDEAPIDIEDMRRNTNYSGGYTVDHPCISMFWKILESFSNQERSQLLKFVTSYSRPPLLGFKELHPPICIQCVEGINERFPTSSTCMNLLKLPAFSDENIMKSKLLYAIQSGAGFELS